jgi:hypothetical protein
MTNLTREQRLQIMLTHNELVALDDWRFARRMPTRAAAIRELLKRGLAAEGFDTARHEAKSRDFNVVAPEAEQKAQPIQAGYRRKR